MKSMTLIELKRAFTSKGMLISLLIGLAITIHQFFYYQQVGNINSNFDLLISCGKATMVLPDYLWGAWIGGNLYLFNNYLFFLLIPILAALPFGRSYLQDTKSGYIRSVFTRTNRRNYYIAKWCATFLSGGVSILVPLTVNFILMLTTYSAMGPYPETFHAPIIGSDMLAGMFFSKPFLYIGIYLIMIFVFSGLFATLCLFSTLISDYSFVIYMLPFLTILFLTMVLDFFGFAGISPQEFLNPSLGNGSVIVIVCEAILFLILSLVPFLVHGLKKRDF